MLTDSGSLSGSCSSLEGKTTTTTTTNDIKLYTERKGKNKEHTSRVC